MSGAQMVQIARRRAGLTQAQLAERAGCTQAQLSLWESGGRTVSLATLQRLVAGCGLDLTLDLTRGDRSLEEMARDQLALAPADRLRRLVAPVEAERALMALRLAGEASEGLVLIGGLAAVLQGGPTAPSPVIQLTAGDSERAREGLWQAGWAPVEVLDRFGGLHARERLAGPADAWELELVDRPGGVPDPAPLLRDAVAIAGLGTVRVASVRDLWRIATGSPWQLEDRGRRSELSALLDLQEGGAPPLAA